VEKDMKTLGICSSAVSNGNFGLFSSLDSFVLIHIYLLTVKPGKNLVGQALEVKIIPVDSIPIDQASKFRSVISKVGKE